MDKKTLPSPLYKPGDVVYLKCSRKGLGIGGCIFGTIIKLRWNLGYDYWIKFQPKGQNPVTIKLHEGALGPKDEYDSNQRWKRSEHLTSFKNWEKHTRLCRRMDQLEHNINDSIAQIRQNLEENRRLRKKIKLLRTALEENKKNFRRLVKK